VRCFDDRVETAIDFDDAHAFEWLPSSYAAAASVEPAVGSG
jgi:hypothetical protein